MSNKQIWSDKLRKETLTYFTDMGFAFLKGENCYAIGYDRTICIDEECKRLIPGLEKAKKIFLFKYSEKKRDNVLDSGCPVTEPVFLKAYNSVEEMIDDNWALD